VTSANRTRLQAARHAEGWSQAQVIVRLRAAAAKADSPISNEVSLKTQLSRWENGHDSPGPMYRRLFRMIYGMTDEELGFTTGQPEVFTSLSSPQLTKPVIDYFAGLFQQHVRADSEMGGRLVLPIVEQQVQTFATMLRQTRGPVRRTAVGLAWHYQEFLGWLYQDSARPDQALLWTSRAHDLAIELEDPTITGYLYMRRSNIASDLDDAPQALALADAALRTLPGRGGPIVAVALRQHAHALADLGETASCAAAIDRAFEALTVPNENPGYADYCTPQYVAMEGGTCWVRLRQPRRALETFAQAPGLWADSDRRDYGLALARMATAHVAAGNLDEACRIGEQAVAVARLTTSIRTLRHLQRLRQTLRPWRRDQRASRLAAGIGSLMGDAT
jgi:tetratricopeptide (TPR) repeat protein